MARDVTPAEAVARAVWRDVLRVVRHDPLVRLRAEADKGDSAVHQMRVGCRRLRGDLRVFRPLLGAGGSDHLRSELSWLADVLGGVRDLEVTRVRLHRTATCDPGSPLDADHLAVMDETLAARETSAWNTLDGALSSARYLALLELLVDAADNSWRTDTLRVRTLRRLVRKPWRRLVGAAADLTADAPDETWHAVRIRTKGARYAVESVAEVFGDPAPALADALSDVQDVLGEHQDAVSAAGTWLALSDTDPARLGVTAGRLIERERSQALAARMSFPAVWHAASRRRLTGWLR